MLEPLTPIYTAELFAPLHDELMRLLRGLDDADWNRQTVAPAWRVREVIGHMLDVHLRKLSGGRDGYRSTRPVSPSFADITAFINELNAGGVGYSTRLSPRVMTDVLDVAGRWVADFAMSLAPDKTALHKCSLGWRGAVRELDGHRKEVHRVLASPDADSRRRRRRVVAAAAMAPSASRSLGARVSTGLRRGDGADRCSDRL